MSADDPTCFPSVLEAQRLGTRPTLLYQRGEAAPLRRPDLFHQRSTAEGMLVTQGNGYNFLGIACAWGQPLVVTESA